MMRDREANGVDEETELRRRVRQQVEPQYAPEEAAAPIPAAPFDEAPTEAPPSPKFAAAPTAAPAPVQLPAPGPYAPAPATKIPSAAAPTARPAAAAPSATGYNRALEDQWLNFVGQNYSSGASSRGGGFHAGGNQYRGNLQGVADAFNQQTGGQARVAGEDRIDFGYGPVDVITSDGDWWMEQPAGTGGGGGGGGSSSGGGGGGQAAAPAPTGGGGSLLAGGGQGGWTQDFITQLRAMLMQRLGEAGKPVDENDAYIQAPLSAARNEASRQIDTERGELAERLYAQGGGLNTGALTQGIQASRERTATGLGNLRATLITRELDSRRTEMRDLLQMALASGDASLAREVQMQLAQLEATLRREGYGLQAGMFEANLNQQAVNAGGGF
jgi:hypothetical protein